MSDLIAPLQPVRQAILRALRANLVLKAALPGDWSEGAAPPKTARPLGVIALVPSPALYDWTGVIYDLVVDVAVFSEDAGEAASLDQLVFTTLQGTRLAVTGLTSLSVQRLGVLALEDVDEKGTSVFMAGASWRIRVSQSNPVAQSLVVTVNSTIA
jgi:hypothetical protein